MTQTEPLIPGFARVRVASRTFRLVRITGRWERMWAGERVNRDGSPWERSKTVDGVLHVTHELIMFQPEDVVERLVLNTRYAELEPER